MPDPTRVARLHIVGTRHREVAGSNLTHRVVEYGSAQHAPAPVIMLNNRRCGVALAVLRHRLCGRSSHQLTVQWTVTLLVNE